MQANITHAPLTLQGEMGPSQCVFTEARFVLERGTDDMRRVVPVFVSDARFHTSTTSIRSYKRHVGACGANALDETVQWSCSEGVKLKKQDGQLGVMGELLYEVSIGGVNGEFTPAWLTGAFVRATVLPPLASAGVAVRNALVCVPASCGVQMRMQTAREVQEALGAERCTVGPEPVLNAIGMVLDRNIQKPIVVGELDLGAGTDDLALLNIDGGMRRADTVATATTWRGGDRCTSVLTDAHVLRKIAADGTPSQPASWAEMEVLKRLNFGGISKKPFQNLRNEAPTTLALPGFGGPAGQVQMDTRRLNTIVLLHYAETLVELLQQVVDKQGRAPHVDHWYLAGGASQAVHLRFLLQVRTLPAQMMRWFC